MKSQALSLRPYARLLTMLGDQLIKNERIALVELIKNAYDADANQVDVRFEEFNLDMTHNEQSRIVIIDDGDGMSLDTVLTRWMNPAAPQKHLEKLRGDGRTPGKNRVIQGEKGIGRFAVLKMGKVITVTTRTPNDDLETVLNFDFARFDDDFVSENGQEREIFLDEIKIDCSRSVPTKLTGAEHGTLIEIEKLKGAWNETIVKHLCRDVSNLTDPVSRIKGQTASKPFEIGIFCNKERRSVEAQHTETLKALIEDKPVLNIQGRFNSNERAFAFEIEGGYEKLSLLDSKFGGLWVWRQRFPKPNADASVEQEYRCGDFGFQFYIFDFSRGISGRHALKQVDKNLLKEHRIYLYRDEMRVYPYGDPDDDWLNIDVTRGTGRAGDFFSNDQIIGWIDITQKGNPELRDKTNREGLIETGGAANDLIFLVQTFLSYIKQYPFARYQEMQRQRKTARFVRDDLVTQHLADLKQGLKQSGDQSRASEVAKIETEYKREKEYLSQRADITEDLAGVGLSVEMASHDIMILMGRAHEIGSQLAQAARSSGDDEIQNQADMLVGVLQQVTAGMRDVQSLFKASLRRRKVLKVEPVLDKIHQIYRAHLEEKNIRYDKVNVGTSPLTANTNDGVVMQVLINLFDNAAYWLETIESDEREIRVIVDGEQGELVFSDSGPGIDPDDLPYIFEPFYSGKGQEGRGLGLYIARQLLDRHDYRIGVAEDHCRALPGATFVVSFVKEDA